MDTDDRGVSIENAFEVNEVKKRDLVNKNRIKDEIKKDLKRSKYSQLCAQLETKLNNIQTDVHSEFINQMINYIHEYQDNLNGDDKFRLSFVHTGIIQISCSASEYEFIFDLFIKKLIENDLDKVISISSTEKLTVEKIIDMIYKKVLTDDVLEEIGIVNNKYKKIFYQTLNFNQFASIYNKFIGNKPIILIFNDLIFMNCETINNLFHFLHAHLDKVPVLVFCGISHASVSLQSLIKPKILNCLLITSFSSKNVFEIIDQIFYSTFIDSDLSLKFGSKCLTYFLDTFNYYDFSIKNVERLVKLAIWDFCYLNENAFLNGTKEEFALKLKKLNKDQLMKLRNIESLTEFEFDENKMKEQLIKLFGNMSKIESKFKSELKALFELIYETDNKTGKLFRDLYINFLSTESAFKEELNKLTKVFMSLTYDDWKDKLEKIIDNELINQTELVELLNRRLDELNHLQEKSVEEKKDSPKGRIRSRAEWILSLAKMAKSPVSTSSSFNNWKKNTVDLIKKHFEDLLNPSYDYLNELFYYDNVDQLKKYSLISIRETILDRLDNPEEFFRSIQEHESNEVNEMNQLDTIKPDICVAFQTYKESQIKINVADWSNTYSLILEQNEAEKKAKAEKRPRKKRKLDNNETLKRFLSNLYDLEYLGILEKTSKSSSDYVTKLIFD